MGLFAPIFFAGLAGVIILALALIVLAAGYGLFLVVPAYVHGLLDAPDAPTAAAKGK